MLAGVSILASGLLAGPWILMFSALFLASGIPVIYSYLLYRRIEGF